VQKYALPNLYFYVMIKINLTVLILFIAIKLLSQNAALDKKRDYQWYFGYQDFKLSTNKLDFNVKPAQLTGFEKKYSEFDKTNGNICDSNGKMLFYTNGCFIGNKNNEIVAGSQNLNEGAYKTTFCTQSEGILLNQAALFVSKPNQDSLYYLFHTTIDTRGYCHELMLTTIDAKANQGAGKVIQLNQKLINDSLEYRIVANRHANGRDWWLLLCQHTLNPENDDIYYKVLIQPDSISINKQVFEKVPKRKKKYYSQNGFSPDGKLFVRYRDADGVYVMDFDRTTGALSNQRHFAINAYDWNGGVAFSPDSRFLYVAAADDIYQIDLVENTKQVVAVWDKFTSSIFTTQFGFSLLGPDCKIYIAPLGAIDYLAVINFPNRKGTACAIEQRAIKTPTRIAHSLPNYPHFRLGKEGETHTPCDSTINPYLTVTKNIKEEVPVTFAVYPNPAQDHINVDLFGYVQRFERGTWDLYDISGKLAASFPLLQGHSEYVFDVSNIPNGVYVWRVSFNGVPTSFAGKVVVMRE
jgi:hypothetical protein